MAAALPTKGSGGEKHKQLEKYGEDSVTPGKKKQAHRELLWPGFGCFGETKGAILEILLKMTEQLRKLAIKWVV